jgi:ATP dependent DNA ligase domain
MDGFRARRVHRKRPGPGWFPGTGTPNESFPALTAAIAASLSLRDAILDGEIVHLDPHGVPQFLDLMRRRRPQHFYAFDLVWLDGRDLRAAPLVKRKRLLAGIVPPRSTMTEANSILAPTSRVWKSSGPSPGRHVHFLIDGQPHKSRVDE